MGLSKYCVQSLTFMSFKVLILLLLKKIEYFADDEGSDYVGFTLEDDQIVFNIETGEDEEGPWYEASVEILNFGDED